MNMIIGRTVMYIAGIAVFSSFYALGTASSNPVKILKMLFGSCVDLVEKILNEMCMNLLNINSVFLSIILDVIKLIYFNFLLDFQEFIKNNLHMLETKVNKSKKAMPSTLFYGPVLSPRRLSLRSSSTIDLTEDSFQASEPEVIVLDDCVDTTIRSRNSNKTIEIIDLDETLNSFPRTSRSIGNEIQVIGIKSLKSSVQSRLPDVDVKVVKSISGPRNDFSSLRRSKRKSNGCIETPRKSKAKEITYSEKRLSYMSNDSMLSEASENKVKEPKRKKRKLCDVSNIIPKVSSKTYTPNTKPLSGKLFSKFYNQCSDIYNSWGVYFVFLVNIYFFQL